MADFSTNISPITQNLQQNTTPQRKKTNVAQSPLGKYWRAEKRKNSGLIEKLYNKIKNATGLGVGSKKVGRLVVQANQGQIDTRQAVNEIKKYSKSQETSAQLFGDILSVGASAFTFFGLNKIFKYTNSYMKINKPIIDKKYASYEKTRDEILKVGENESVGSKEVKVAKAIFRTCEEIFKTAKSNKRLTALTLGLAGLAGGITKYWGLKINRIDSSEYKLDRTRFNKKTNYGKQEKKRLNRERRRTNHKNFISGVINGLTMPIMALGGAVGAPIYLAINSLNRYFVAGKAKDKSIGNYFDNLTNDTLSAGIVTAGMAIPLVKKGNFTKVFNENIKKVTNELASKELKKPEFNTKSAYQQLEETMLNSPKVKSIINGNMKMDKKINKLTEENIFAVKFQQIKTTESGNSFIDGILEIFGKGKEKGLTAALQEDCPPTRTVKQAQKFINDAMGDKKYRVTKLLGVGTIAETYLAKSSDGKEVCIKILKEGISKEKILKDKEQFIDMVKKLSDKSQDEKDYLVRNVEDLAEGIIKEVDLKNEMEAAKKLAKHTEVANVVKPIEVKNNVYVMEKADGVSLKSFMDLNWLYIAKNGIEKGENIPKLLGIEDKIDVNSRTYKLAKRQIIKFLDKQIKKTTDRMPAFKKFDFSKEDNDYLFKEYQKVFVEQFHKINKNGKTIHADVHPGNIFIDPQALKTKEGKLFTLIDTGNTIDMNIEQSMHALKLTEYVQSGNVKDITEYVLDGAKLPKNMTKEEAIKKVSEELKKCFFDKETELEKQNTDKMLAMADSIMQKFDIIPSSTQMNMNKSKTAASNALKNLKTSISFIDGISAADNKSKSKAAVDVVGVGLKFWKRGKDYEGLIEKQEKTNLKQLSPAQILKQKMNPNAPDKNSEDYITYKLKQMKIKEDKSDIKNKD